MCLMKKKEIKISLKSILAAVLSLLVSFSLVYYLETTQETECNIIWPKANLPDNGIQSYSSVSSQYYHTDFETFFGNTIENDRDYYNETKFNKQYEEEFSHPNNLNECYGTSNSVFLKATFKDFLYVLLLSIFFYFVYYFFITFNFKIGK